MRVLAIAVFALTCLPLAALAGTLDDAAVAPVVLPVPEAAPQGPALSFELRGGVQSGPGYLGADSAEIGPDFGFSFNHLRLGPLEFGTPEFGDIVPGFGMRGAFRVIGARSADDYPELEGLADLDLALELGIGATYGQPGYQAFADLRRGVIGHSALVAELGVDMYLRPDDRLTLRAGPRVLVGSDDYAATYFGVTADEAAAGDLEMFEARGGALSAGVEVGATWMVNDLWGIDGAVRYDRFLNDAADSPIVLQGSDDALTARIGLTRRFSLEF